MFARRLANVAARAGAAQRTMATKSSSVNGKGPLEVIYQTFMRNNVVYVSTVVAGALVFEVVYGNVTNSIWESLNYGRLYHHIDWSQFKSEDDEEEEEE
ncbi:unnamed protein product [Aphanomyces euteiches]|uniref:Cytochrome b-c1 complex subunit 9 n=1 Tax=Aphanomyces euteiches TaxID=100861 RepID=A0A6G0WPR3_9STRA|nr:hypothetical protein Ae201684_013089 [Aphanomyces euteiches]KAH9076940.1 hypothetical protein Ae201684P_010869 [Aphanomyces euteiches]KAH9089443.1 hypothetical protein LEN26_019163 [Aphanomyces euteiches]KAH9105907.1 hypothetical protein AeMF1_018411 [Aphanomyces euteiches]KAH9143424.1 hypothetical protein AeRB84_012577 [Aphanomyces euteiches]